MASCDRLLRNVRQSGHSDGLHEHREFLEDGRFLLGSEIQEGGRQTKFVPRGRSCGAQFDASLLHHEKSSK